MDDLGSVTDKDGVLRVRVQPGPGMRWFAQGFFMGLGFMAATAVVWIVLAIIVAASVSN